MTKPDQYILRKLHIDDVSATSSMIEKIARNYLFDDFSKEGQANFLKSVTGTGIVNNLKSNKDKYDYLVAEFNGEIVGVISLKNNSHLFNLFVDEAHHGKGLAKKLWLKCTKAQSVSTYTVFSSKFAIPVYQKLGFVITGDPVNKGGIYCIPMELSTVGSQINL